MKEWLKYIAAPAFSAILGAAVAFGAVRNEVSNLDTRVYDLEHGPVNSKVAERLARLEALVEHNNKITLELRKDLRAYLKLKN